MGTKPQNGTDHHYVPRFYLNCFKSKTKALWIYEKGAVEPRESTPKAEGCHKNYYAFADFGELDDSAEHMLETLECLVAPIFHNLRRREHRMSAVEVGHLFAFMGVMFARVPAYREYRNRLISNEMKLYAQKMMKQPGVFEKFLKYYEVERGRQLANSEEVRKAVLEGKFDLEQNSTAMNLVFIFRDAQEIGKVLVSEYSYDLYYAPAGSFYVTGDNPIVTITPQDSGNAMIGPGFSWPRTQVIFPLNKRVCAILRREGGERKIDATPQKFAEINRLLMFAAQKQLYAAENSANLIREFNEHGCELKYGENALIPFDFNA